MTRPTPLRVRFFAKVEKRETCWLWTGATTKGGYSKLWNDGHWDSGHRLSYLMHVGPIPEELFVLHTCDVRHCVNPAHLFLGTALDNTQDMKQKGRGRYNGAPGSRNSHAVLTEDDVRAIRRRMPLSASDTQALARRYNVYPSTIRNAARGVTWKKVA